MKRITTIEFVNYKAFYQSGDENRIIIPEGKSVLLYGENGSGKSSIYEGLKQFFQSSDSTIETTPARHIKVAKTKIVNQGEANEAEMPNEVSVKVTFSDSTGDEIKTFGVPENDTQGADYVAQANLLNSFLSYRELLRTYLIENPKDRQQFRIKFAELVIEVILAKQRNTATQGTFQKSWNNLFIPRVWYKEENLERFNRGLKQEISRINLLLPVLLQYFEEGFSVKLEITKNEIEKYHSPKEDRWGKYPICEIDLQVSLFGERVDNDEENHLTVLNEARLSSLAISIYLASLINTPQDNFSYKILFLDDIFIGLDMSNRLPLLEILKSFKKPIIEQYIDAENDNQIAERLQKVAGVVKTAEFPFFEKYQIFISTYDKHWFNLAKLWFESKSPNKWCFLELFANHKEGQNFTTPILLTSLNYFQKANYYYTSHDYAACGNYLRKEFEFVLKNLLYGKYLLIGNGKTGEIKSIDELGDLWNNFYTSQNSLLSSLGFKKDIYQEFEFLSKTVLNPLSHDNLDKPLYRGELDIAFNLLNKIKSIEKTVMLPAKGLLQIRTLNKNLSRITTIKLLGDIIVYKQLINKGEGDAEIRFGVPEYKVIPVSYEEDNAKTDLSNLKECSLSKAYDMVYHNVFGILKASSYSAFDFEDEFIHVESGLTLRQLFLSI